VAACLSASSGETHDPGAVLTEADLEALSTKASRGPGTEADDDLGRPRNLRVEAATQTSIFLKWEFDPGAGAGSGSVRYQIYYAHDNNTSSKSHGSSATSFELVGLGDDSCNRFVAGREENICTFSGSRLLLN
jgi:hypothetical protein